VFAGLARWPPFLKLIGPVSVSVINQLLSGGTNFVLSIYFVRTMKAEDFGIYGLCFAASLFLSGLGSSFLLVRMVVELPRRALTERHKYAASVLRAALLISALTLSSSAFIALAMAWRSARPEATFILVLGVGAAGVTGFLREFVLRYAYSASREGWAVLINTWMAVLMLMVAYSLNILDMKPSASMGIWLVAGGQLIGTFAGLRLARLSLNSASAADAYHEIASAWRSGRWTIAANLVNWARMQSYSVLSPALAGFGGLAKLNAVRVLISPAVFLLPAIGQLTLPRLSAISAIERSAVPSVAASIAAALFGISVAYIALLFLTLEPVSTFVMKGRYTDIEGLAVAWSTYLGIQVCAVVALLALQAMGQFRYLFFVSVIGTSLTILAIGPFFAVGGLEGIVFSMALGEVAALLMMITRIVKLSRDTR